MQTLCIPPPAHSGSFNNENTATKPLFGGLQAGDLEAARQARAAKLAKWATLDLRQDFDDAAFMRQTIKAAGLRAPTWTEPASTPRLRTLLHLAGVNAVESREALGTTLSGYLTLNKGLPLWAALALVLEATGRFTDAALALSDPA